MVPFSDLLRSKIHLMLSILINERDTTIDHSCLSDVSDITLLQLDALWRHLCTRDLPYTLDGRRLTQRACKVYFLSLMNRLLLPYKLQLVCRFAGRKEIYFRTLPHKVRGLYLKLYHTL